MQAAHTQAATAAPLHFIPTARARIGADATGAPQCSTCVRRDLCLPGAFNQQELRGIDSLMFARRKVKAGEALYRQGEKFQFLYAVRSGTFKSVTSLRDGREHVAGFALAGDMLGLDALAAERHASEAVALEDSEICAIPWAQLRTLASEHRNMQMALTQLLGKRIVGEQRTMLLLGSMTAEERVAAFLLDISGRMQALGYSGSEFHLRMSRAEIGSYLGLTLETVSRAFSAFQSRGLLEVAKKHIRILDLALLARSYDAAPQLH